MSARLLGSRGGRLWLSVGEFSDATGKPAQTVRRWLREGRLHGRKVGEGRGTWRVLAREVERVNGRGHDRRSR